MGVPVVLCVSNLMSTTSCSVATRALSSVGVTLWEIASQKRPYAGKTTMRVMRMISNGEHDEIPDDTPPALALGIEQAWALKPEDRPSAQTLGAILRGEGSAGSSATSTV